MMSSKVTSIGLKGLEGYQVRVEVQAIPGTPSIVIVGLPDASVKESKQRITAAFHSYNYMIHHQKLIINLSPPEQKKNGPMFDLPIAIGILVNMQEIRVEIPETTGFIGALSLDGSIHPTKGQLSAVLAAKGLGLKKLYLPYDETFPLIEMKDLDLVFVHHLHEVINLIEGKPIAFIKNRKIPEKQLYFYADFQFVIGHNYAKHALEIAAAGEHHLFMSGPPGCGKSMLAECLPSILPILTKEQRLEIMSIYQLSGISNHDSMYPPFRSPHHSSSGVSIIGGGSNPMPGEISLSHNGVLFLDEIAEFPKKTLEMLRQPLEAGAVTISRARSSVTYPSSFILIGAMNPCPCGFLGSNTQYCTCTPKQISAYQNRLSGPMRDRFDIFLSLKPIDLSGPSEAKQESSQLIRERVADARQRQYHRYGKEISNGRVQLETLLQTSPLTDQQWRLLQQLANQQGWSNRAQIKIIRLARTIADLQQSPLITQQHIWEAKKLHKWTSAKKGAGIDSSIIYFDTQVPRMNR